MGLAAIPDTARGPVWCDFWKKYLFPNPGPFKLKIWPCLWTTWLEDIFCNWKTVKHSCLINAINICRYASQRDTSRQSGDLFNQIVSNKERNGWTLNLPIIKKRILAPMYAPKRQHTIPITHIPKLNIVKASTLFIQELKTI